MLYDSYINGRTINLGNGTFVFYMSIFFAHFCYPDMAIFDETKVDIISLSTNKKCEKRSDFSFLFQNKGYSLNMKPQSLYPGDGIVGMKNFKICYS